VADALERLALGAGPILGDAYGQACLHAWNEGDCARELYVVAEREDAYVGIINVADAFTAPEDWAPTERAIIDRARGRVLDIGCGPGRHAVVLQAAGHAVVGVDVSPGAVEVARRRGVDARLGRADELEDVPAHFDTIVLGGQNIGLLGRREHAGQVLAGMAAVTRHDAIIVGTAIDPYRMPARYAEYNKTNPPRGRLYGQQCYRLRYGRLASEWTHYLYLSPDELGELLVGSPWLLEDVVDHGMDYVAQLRKRV